MKATDLLKQQHRKAEELFGKAEQGDDAALQELANDLVAHMAIEQELFYPAVRELEPAKISSSFEEHSIAELALKRALDMDPEDEQFKARVTVLKALILHHVQEEESALFPAVEKKMPGAALDELGEQMQLRFEEVVAEGYDAVLPEGLEETSADQALEEADADELDEGDEAENTVDDTDDEKVTTPAHAAPSKTKRTSTKRPSHGSHSH